MMKNYECKKMKMKMKKIVKIFLMRNESEFYVDGQ